MEFTTPCGDYVYTLQFCRTMAQSASPTAGEAGPPGGADPAERLVRVSQHARKRLMISFVCVCAAIIEALPCRILPHVATSANAALQPKPLPLSGNEASTPVAGVQLISNKQPRSSTPADEIKGQHHIAPVQSLAEHRRVAASTQKQVEEQHRHSVGSRKQDGHRGQSETFGSGQPHDLKIDSGADETDSKFTPFTQHSIADTPSSPVRTVHSAAAAHESERSRLHFGRPPSQESSLLQLTAVDSLHSNEVANLYGGPLPSDASEGLPFDFGNVPKDKTAPTDSPLSGPLEELYVPVYNEAYGTTVSPDEESSRSAFPRKAERADAHDEPPDVARAVDQGVRVAQHVRVNDMTHVESEKEELEQLRRPGPNTALGNGAGRAGLAPASYQKTESAFSPEQLSAHGENIPGFLETEGQRAEGWKGVEYNHLTLQNPSGHQQPQLSKGDAIFARLQPTLQQQIDEVPAAADETDYKTPSTTLEETFQEKVPQLDVNDEASPVHWMPIEHMTEPLAAPPINVDERPFPFSRQGAAALLPLTESASSAPLYSPANSAVVAEDSTGSTSNYMSDEKFMDEVGFSQNWKGRSFDGPGKKTQQDGQLRDLHSTQERLHQHEHERSAALGLPAPVNASVADPTDASADWHDKDAQTYFTGEPNSSPYNTGYLFQPETVGQAKNLPSREEMAFSSPPRRTEPQEEASAAEEAPTPAEVEGTGDQEVAEHGPTREEVVPLGDNGETEPKLLEAETPSSVITESDDVTEFPPEASSEAPLTVDPREGACSPDELTALTEYFSNQSDSCAAYRCIDEADAEFLEKLQEHYGAVYEPIQLEELAGLFAACYCRCPMMKCEVDYVMDHGSPSCKGATVDYCESSNEKFVQRCTSAAQQLPLLYDLRLDTAGFKVPCRVCRREDMGTSIADSVSTADGADEHPSLGSDDSLAPPSDSSSFNDVGSGSTSPAEDRGPGEENEEIYEATEEEEKEAGLDRVDDDDYDEELPLLQLDQRVSTGPSRTSSLPPQATTAEEEGGILPVQEEQESDVEAEPEILGDTENPLQPSTPAVPPSPGSVETEISSDDQLQGSPPVEGQEERVEAAADDVTAQNSAFRQARRSVEHIAVVVVLLLVSSLAL